MKLLEHVEMELCDSARAYAQSGMTAKNSQEASGELLRARVRLKLAAITFAAVFGKVDEDEL